MSQWSVLALTRHTPTGASSRLRTFQYIPWIEAEGGQVTVSPFFDQIYLDNLYRTGSRQGVNVIKAYMRRLYALRTIRRHDVLWIEKEVLPYVPGTLERWLLGSTAPYLLDYDDASFHTYDEHRNPWIREHLGHKLTPLIRGASSVCAGNRYLANYMVKQGAGCVVQIPTVVDLDNYPVFPLPKGDALRIGWIGTPATTKYLQPLIDVLRSLQTQVPLTLVTIGASPLGNLELPLEQHDWTEETEAQLLGTVHVGVMPLPDEPWERGKCGYKLIQYMACGRAVIASPVGVNQELVTPEVGFLAKESTHWIDALKRLHTDRVLCEKMGMQGRRLVEQRYCLQTTGPQVATMLKRYATENKTR